MPDSGGAQAKDWTMKVSIAMATYNGARYLPDQLDSFLRQNRQPDELVVCDDGSTDATPEILGWFRQGVPFPVHLYRHKKNLGFAKTFETAISNCSGELIFLSDQDDIWFPTKIGVVEQTLLSTPGKLLLVHDGELVDENLVSHGVTYQRQVLAGYRSLDHLATGALTAVRRELLQYALPFPAGVVGHDGWLHDIARLLHTRLVLEQPLQLVRRHSSNTSAWVASSIKKINALDVWRSQRQSAVATGYEDRILINELSHARLADALNKGNFFSHDALEDSLFHLESERRALGERNRLTEANSIKRKIIAVQMFLRGDYRHFNGYRSFLRDLAR
jgi:glycosyltransferase involved in cell wall biosynthesis